jgi:hypothetical protein
LLDFQTFDSYSHCGIPLVIGELDVMAANARTHTAPAVDCAKQHPKHWYNGTRRRAASRIDMACRIVFDTPILTEIAGARRAR